MAYNPDVPSFDNYGVEDLNKMRENFQILANIATRREDILSLAVETGDILDSRIVEHNLIILSPSNGYYVRWENGLQVCWYRQSVTGSGSSWATLNWTYSAAFVERPIVVSAPAERYVSGTGYTTQLYTVHAVDQMNTNSNIRYIYNDTFDSTVELVAHLLAIGRWK